MSEDKIRMGIIGVGWFALRGQWPPLKEDRRVEVVAICRRNEELLAVAAKITGVSSTYTDWRKMLAHEQLDAVLVCTPNRLHAEPTIAALNHGLHVLVEKPMALSTMDAEAMIAAASASKGHLMVGYKWRCDPLWRAAVRSVREGAIGRVLQVSTVCFDDALLCYDRKRMPKGWKDKVENSGRMRPFWEDVGREGNWRGDLAAAEGGMFVDNQTHNIDRMLWVAGSPARQVSCLLTRDGLPVERAITTQAHLKNGVLFSLSYTNGVDADQERYWGKTEVTITGDSGVLLGTQGPLGTDTGETQIEIISNGKRRRLTSDEEIAGTPGMFVDLIANGGENPAPPEECAWTVALTEASYRSAKEKRFVTLG